MGQYTGQNVNGNSVLGPFGKPVAFRKQLFKQQSGKEPAGSIVKADDFADIPSGFFIVPGAESLSAKQNAGDIFSQKNDAGINETAEYEVSAFQQTADRG